MNYKLVAFDLDNTLIKEWSIYEISKGLNFSKKLEKLNNLVTEGKIKQYELSRKVAELLKGKTKNKIHSLCKKLHIRENVKYVINFLKSKGIKVGIITTQLSSIAEYFATELNVDFVISSVQKSLNGTFTGSLDLKYLNMKCKDEGNNTFTVCKKLALERVANGNQIKLNECIVVGDGETDLCLFKTSCFKIALEGYEKIERLADVIIKRGDMKKILNFI